MVTNGPSKKTSGLRLKNQREAIVKRPSLSVRTSWESRYSSLGPPKLRTCLVHQASTTTLSSGCFVSALTTCACQGPADSEPEADASRPTNESSARSADFRITVQNARTRQKPSTSP